MKKTYAMLEEEELRKAKKDTQQYTQSLRSRYDAQKAQVGTQYDALIQKAQSDYARQVEQTKASFADWFDANAVSEAVARRRTEEALTNAGLLKSGLGTTQQTAISLSRSRADATTLGERQSAVQRLMSELDNVVAQYRQKSLSEQAAVDTAFQKAVVDYEQQSIKQARNLAWDLYSSDDNQKDTAQNLGVRTPTGQVNPYITLTGHASVYGELTNEYKRNGKVYTKWDAGKWRVYDLMKHYWEKGAFGDIDRDSENAKSNLILALTAHMQSGNLRDYKTVIQIANAIHENQPLE